MNLGNRTVLITGGNSGIGLTLAKRLRDAGSTVIVTGRSADKLEAAAQAVPGLVTIQSDITDPDAINALVERVEREFPKLDMLVNNAGLMILRNLGEPADDLVELTREIGVNVSGPIRTTSAFIGLLKRNHGAVVNVSSGLAYVPLQAAPIYCATKAAIHSYTVTLRQQLAGQVDVIELMPPATRTPMISDISEGGAFDIMTVDAMVDAAMKGLAAGHTEIRPGQANQLYWMSRVAPGFIQGQLAKGSAGLVPAANA